MKVNKQETTTMFLQGMRYLTGTREVDVPPKVLDGLVMDGKENQDARAKLLEITLRDTDFTKLTAADCNHIGFGRHKLNNLVTIRLIPMFAWSFMPKGLDIIGMDGLRCKIGDSGLDPSLEAGFYKYGILPVA